MRPFPGLFSDMIQNLMHKLDLEFESKRGRPALCDEQFRAVVALKVPVIEKSFYCLLPPALPPLQTDTFRPSNH